jgi:hypothetical protein
VRARAVASRGTAGIAAASVLVAGAIGALFGRVGLSYDSYFALLWGSDLAHGRAPQYELPFAGTPHPLLNVVGAVLSPLGRSADDGLWVIVLLTAGALCVAVFLVGREIAGWPVGALAAALVATRMPLLQFAATADVDVPAAALLMWAVVLELRRPKRGAPVFVLLALAGLLRPEAWLLSGAYWLWLAAGSSRGQRIGRACLAAAAPVLWILSDTAVTGDPLWSSHRTALKAADGASTAGLAGLARVPNHIGGLLWVPASVAAVAGVAIAVWLVRRRGVPADSRLRLPLALLGLSALATIALAVAGQTVFQRFFVFPAALLVVFAALAALGWLTLGADARERRLWRAGGVALALLFAAFLPSDVDRIVDLRAQMRADRAVELELADLVAQPAGRAAVHTCRPIYVPAGQLIPAAAYFAGLRPSAFSTDAAHPQPSGLFLVRAPSEAPQISPQYRPLARNGSWIAIGGCRPAPAP